MGSICIKTIKYVPDNESNRDCSTKIFPTSISNQYTIPSIHPNATSSFAPNIQPHPSDIWNNLQPRLRNAIEQAILKIPQLNDLAKKKNQTSWLEMLNLLKNLINSFNSESNLLSNELLVWVIEKLEIYTFNKQEKIQLIKWFKRYFKLKIKKGKFNNVRRIFKKIG